MAQSHRENVKQVKALHPKFIRTLSKKVEQMPRILGSLLLFNNFWIQSLSKRIFTLPSLLSCRPALLISYQQLIFLTKACLSQQLSIRATIRARALTRVKRVAAAMALQSILVDTIFRSLMKKSSKLQREWLEQRDAIWSVLSSSVARICHREQKLWNSASEVKALASKKGQSKKNQKSRFICASALDFTLSTPPHVTKLNSCSLMCMRSSRSTVSVPRRTSSQQMALAFYR